jgi:acetyl esterase/lipase
MRKTLVAVLLILLAAITASAQEKLDPATEWATNAFNEFHVSPNIVYQRASGVSLKLDVITAGPASTTRPTLVYFHGGGLVEGAKEGAILNTLPYLARGMNAVNVEYRMAPDSLAPAAVEDGRCALHWVYDNAEKYGFDTSKIVVAGHSAGGYLALMTGMLAPGDNLDNACTRMAPDWREGTIRNVKVAAIVNFFGITDYVDLLQGANTRNFAVRWFGDLPNRMELARQLSPVSYVRGGLPPIITIAGDQDPVVPYQHQVRLHDALTRQGIPNQLITIQGGGHGSTPPYVWNREQNLHAQEAIFEFLEKHGILAPAPGAGK